MSPPRPLRCAIYTRKSSEEGLDQSFNSLHAQREACEAYIKSQAHEGWRPIDTAYDDGGFSGGSMERPGLKRLLADIEHQRVDVIVVYKVDRLTRSLTDFARIVEVLDKQSVSFVSVTQHFNTTSSMGRLTLNVLLSFAQFEREVTGERIRDKFAASRAKGMWMGGRPPLGYDVSGRKLVVNEAEAEQVRSIYACYLKLGSVAALSEELRRHGMHSKRWTTQIGITRGGAQFSRGALYTLLRNRVYLGDAVHKGKAFPGEHDPIVPVGVWEQVQARLAANGHERTESARTRAAHPLAGLLFDDRGNLMSPSHAKKKCGKRYRYYVSQALLRHRSDEAGTITRVPADEIEDIVAREVLKQLDESQRREWARLSLDEQTTYLKRIMRRVELKVDCVMIALDASSPESQPTRGARGGRGGGRGRSAKATVMRIPIRLKTRRGAPSIILSPNTGGAAERGRQNTTLVRAIARSWGWREALANGDAISVEQIAAVNGMTERYVREMVQFAFLAPSIIEQILSGWQRRDLSLAKLRRKALPLSWGAQANGY